MYEEIPREIDFGSSWREDRVRECLSYRESTVFNLSQTLFDNIFVFNISLGFAKYRKNGLSVTAVPNA